jgi:hypothetical protein
VSNKAKPRVSRQSKCHWRIAKVAKEIAHIRYDAYASDNAFFAMYPNEARFVQKFWGVYIDIARDLLANLLTDPMIGDAEKEQIYDALLLDGTVNPRALTSIEQANIIDNTDYRLLNHSSQAMH